LISKNVMECNRSCGKQGKQTGEFIKARTSLDGETKIKLRVVLSNPFCAGRPDVQDKISFAKALPGKDSGENQA
jgi:hypothetical protein